MITIKDAEEILKKEYHIDNFLYLINDILLPDFKSDKHDVVFKNSIFAGVTQLGNSADCDVTIYEVILKPGVEKRRVAITQEMFRILRGQGVNNAVVAFANADRNNYRISLLTSKYEFSGDKIVKVISNPRRYSYALGYGTKTKTAYKFLIEKGKVDSLEELTARFSVEVVNKQFYSEIAACFTELVGGDRDGRHYERQLKLQSATNSNKYSEFAVRLIGRIVFCWFLKEKKSESGLPLLPESMVSLDGITDNYYHTVLEPLFFELLNTNANRRKGKYAEEEIYQQIPYLNGGLFSPHNDDMYKFDRVNQCGTFGTVTIPDNWFRHFYGVLSQYNFTVDENTSYDIELSIDPEMLGRIFENLLAEINPETGENAKKSTGSFYTPRDIVDYMVDNSILEYLKTKTGIDDSRLKALISYAKEDDELAEFNNAEKRAIINALYTVTVLDPACGSGAFPIGMLQKIVYILQQVDPEANLWFEKATEKWNDLFLKKAFEKRFKEGSLDYIRKLKVIQNSIFGVDIQPIAVEIARLRCFLSLVIEEKVYDDEPNRGINPLPSLDFKFIIANTLVPLDNRNQLSMFENQQFITELKNVREEYFNADSDRKTELKLEFAEIQKRMYQDTIDNYTKQASRRYAELSRWSPFSNETTAWFDPEWMFGVANGFDIVIANPPYVSVKSIDDSDKETYRSIYRSGKGRFNLFTLMIERGISLLTSDGTLTYIQPEGIFTNIEYRFIREIIVNETSLLSVTMFDNRVFAAAVDTAVLQVCKPHKRNNSFPVIKNMDNTEIILKQDSIIKKDNWLIPVSSTESNSEIIDRMKQQANLNIEDILEIQQGIIYSGRPKDEVFSNLPINSLYKKCLDGRDVKKWYINWAVKAENRYIEYTKKLHRPREERLFLAKEKLLLPRKSTKISLGYDDQQFYVLNTAYIILLKDNQITKNLKLKGILAILNSNLINYYYQNVYLGWQITIPAFNSLPLKYDLAIQDKLVACVDEILCNRGKDISAIEERLNTIVYNLYGLTQEEISIVEQSAM